VSAAENLIARLQRVSQHGPNRWRACCPSHESKHRTQSLSVRELSDGTLLLKCFNGCDAGQIVDAVGLTLKDLFPHDHCAPAEPRHPQRPNLWHSMREAVVTLHHECLVVAIGAEDINAGRPLTSQDLQRIALAAVRVRVRAAIEACL
jgi:hypothetical protein